MTGSMRMEPEEIRSGGTKIGHTGDDLTKVLDTLTSALEAEGECWGDDEAGQKFGGDYTKGRDGVTEGVQKVAKALTDIKDNLKQTADDTEARDQKSGEDIANVPKS